MNGSSICIRTARSGEEEQVLALLMQAARWIQTKGVRQWAHYVDPGPEAKRELTNAISRGEVYLAEQNGRLAGTLSLLLEPSDWDRTLWAPHLTAAPTAAVYLHRLAVAREFAGLGVGDRMLDWAEAKSKAAGKACLRLDCFGENERLNAYYQRRYRFKGCAPARDSYYCKYEKEL